MKRNFKLDAENLIREFEKSQREYRFENAKIVIGWYGKNPKPTKKQMLQFKKDLWMRLSAYYEAIEKRFGKVFMDYVLDEKCKNSMPTKRDVSGPWRPLSKGQIKILKQSEYNRLVSGVVRLLRAGKVKPLSS